MPVVEDPQWVAGYSSDCDTETYYVQFHGFELVTNAEGAAAIRVLYDYTNKGEIPSAFMYDMNLVAFQDGVELQYAWMEDSTQEEQNTIEEIPAGETVTVAYTFDLRSQSPVEIYVEAIWEGAICGVTVPICS